MKLLIWAGAAVCLLGILGLLGVGVKAARAKGEAQGEEDLRNRLSKLLPWNLGALAISTIGLMMVMTGIALG
ncbi:hypothetical protein [Rhodalgimonas zhirmunskyi]|jgi:hypothetical protein|uniref:Uncharacterized protein n=1 Tax=Rhodalgimonas zhirmunskyi TaxID=2964767 RepID=A0AAJ1X5J3_9RHOB|nr:hypothetical protein [Rhodoalgimonas zhirmunskyi]MDQ2095303.1 hypothetical protein [Rhodoalgimonas zhirmunskyi]